MFSCHYQVIRSVVKLLMRQFTPYNFYSLVHLSCQKVINVDDFNEGFIGTLANLDPWLYLDMQISFDFAH